MGDSHRTFNILSFYFILWVLCPCLWGASSLWSSSKAAFSLWHPGAAAVTLDTQHSPLPTFWVCFPSPDTAASIKELLQRSSHQVSSAVLAFASCFPSPSFPSLFAQPLPGPPADGEESAALTNVFIFIWIVCKATRVWETLLNIHTQALTGLLHRALKCALKLGKDKNYLQSRTRSFPCS